MSQDLAQSVAALFEQVASIVARDATLRAALGNVLRAVADRLETPVEPVSTTPPAPEPAPAPVAAAVVKPTPTPIAAQPAAPATPLDLSRLFSGSVAPKAIELPDSEARKLKQQVGHEVLALVEPRSRLKASVLRELAQCRRQATSLDAERVLGWQVQARKLKDGALWMLDATWSPPEDATLLDQGAACFEALADAAREIQSFLAGSTPAGNTWSTLLALLAEAQSAVRVIVGKLHTQDDVDQLQAFRWLRTTAEEQRIYLDRFMRRDDLADPAQAARLRERIAECAAAWQNEHQSGKLIKKSLSKLRYQLNQWSQLPEAERDSAWGPIVQTIAQAVESGLPASNVELRELLVPYVDDVPLNDESPEALRRVLRELERFLSQPSVEAPERRAAPPTEDVLRVRSWLAGSELVLIGGDERLAAKQRLIEAFDLADVRWVATRDHESIEMFRAPVARPEVQVVLLAIRWASHSYGEVQRFCDQAGKFLVRLPGGYSTNQVARMIVDQCGERLQQRSAESASELRGEPERGYQPCART